MDDKKRSENGTCEINFSLRVNDTYEVILIHFETSLFSKPLLFYEEKSGKLKNQRKSNL